MPAGLSAKVYRTQADFILDSSRYVAMMGGRNSGKTHAGSLKAMIRATEGGLGCIAAPNFPMLELGAKRQFLLRLQESGEYFKPTRKGCYIPRWNAEVLFATLENESRVRSPNFDWAWVDEADYLTDRKVWRALKGAVRAGRNPQLFVTTTPKGRKLVYDEWVKFKTAAHVLYRATTFDNPFINAEDYVASLGYEGQFYAQEIEASFITFEGVVYPGFNRETAIQTRSCEGWRTVLGVDIGTRNPTAILTIRVGADVERHLERELYRRGMGTDEIVAAIESEADLAQPEVIYLDPSAASYILTLQQHGYPAVKANNEIVFGIGVVTTALAEGMTIDPACVNTVAELESYAYPENRTEKDKPLKVNDHAMDGLRYGLVGANTPPVEFGIW